MNAFLTGSYAYGTPTEDSDVDLVVLCDEDALAALKEHGIRVSARLLSPAAFFVREGFPIYERDPDVIYPDCDCVSVKFGKLNIIATVNETIFASWFLGTRKLMRGMPKTRAEAVDVIGDLLRRFQG